MEINSISSTLDKCEKTDKHCKISKCRNYSSQIYAASATNIVKLTVGSAFGFTTVLIGELYKDSSEIHMSINDLSLFSSGCFMGPFGCLVLGIMAQSIGCRITMLICLIAYVISFLTFYFATSSYMLLGAQALSGFVGSIAVGPGITYVVEISQPQLRSILTASTTLAAICSAFLIVLLSNFLQWRQLALVILVFPITGFAAVWTIPESPHWLASKKKFDEAEYALSWLRGWGTSQDVASEFNALKKSYTKPLDNFRSSTTKSIGNSSRVTLFKNNIRSYLDKSFYVPLLLMCSLFSLHNCTGYKPLVYYCIVIFSKINAPIDSHVAASIFDAMRILGAISCLILINSTGKKILMYTSLIGAAITLSTSSTALFLKQYHIYPAVCQWIAAIAMMLTTFLTSAGVDKIVYILNAELFPTKHRSVGMAIALFIFTIGGAILNKVFLYMIDALTLAGVFMFFGIVSIVTCIFFHLAFPETEGKTLQEIEAYYNDDKQLENKGKTEKMTTEANY